MCHQLPKNNSNLIYINIYIDIYNHAKTISNTVLTPVLYSKNMRYWDNEYNWKLSYVGNTKKFITTILKINMSPITEKQFKPLYIYIYIITPKQSPVRYWLLCFIPKIWEIKIMNIIENWVMLEILNILFQRF